MNANTKSGLIYDGKGPAENVQGFSAKCWKCDSQDVTIGYEFNYYGGLTGWDQSLWIECRSCGARNDLVI